MNRRTFLEYFTSLRLTATEQTKRAADYQGNAAEYQGHASVGFVVTELCDLRQERSRVLGIGRQREDSIYLELN